MDKAVVLAVDDDPEVLRLISAALSVEGFTVLTASSIKEFWEKDAKLEIDIYIVDITLPDGSGFNVIKELRAITNRGVIVLSGRGSETDHVVGLELGADDYVTKPFRLRELAARVNSVLRRSSAMALKGTPSHLRSATAEPSPPSALPLAEYTFGAYHLSLSARRLWGAGMVEIKLTTAEFDLLIALLKRRNQVLSRDQIMNAVKGREWESYDRAVDGIVSRLRKKIPAPHKDPDYIRTVHGMGYSFIS